MRVDATFEILFFQDTKTDEVFRWIDGYFVSICFPEKSVRSALSYKPVPGDVFLVSYPECGSTWLQQIVYNIYHNHPPPDDMIESHVQLPFLDLEGAESVKKMPRPGAIKTHMPFNLIPYSEQARYIYICRNPYDCCLSYYLHTTNTPVYNFQEGTLDQFLNMFLDGKVDFGDYFVNLLSWYEHRHDPNVFFLTYENLEKDTSTWVLKMADFLGEEYGKRLREDPVLFDSVLKNVDLAEIKKGVTARMKTAGQYARRDPEKLPEWLKLSIESMGEAARRPTAGHFVRKEIEGDWRSNFSPAQTKRLKDHIALKTANSDVMDLWKNLDLP